MRACSGACGTRAEWGCSGMGWAGSPTGRSGCAWLNNAAEPRPPWPRAKHDGGRTCTSDDMRCERMKSSSCCRLGAAAEVPGAWGGTRVVRKWCRWKVNWSTTCCPMVVSMWWAYELWPVQHARNSGEGQLAWGCQPSMGSGPAGWQAGLPGLWPMFGSPEAHPTFAAAPLSCLRQQQGSRRFGEAAPVRHRPPCAAPHPACCWPPPARGGR